MAKCKLNPFLVPQVSRSDVTIAVFTYPTSGVIISVSCLATTSAASLEVLSPGMHQRREALAALSLPTATWCVLGTPAAWGRLRAWIKVKSAG